MNMATQMHADATAHFKQYERMLHDFSRKCIGRAQALEPTMDLEELFSFFSEVYVDCRGKFDPTKGFQFSTYLSTSCFHRFNAWCDRMGRLRKTVSSTSVDGLLANVEGERPDPMEVIPDEGATPEDLAEQKKIRKLMAERIARLEPRFRQVVATLMQGPGPQLKAAFEAHQAELRAAGRYCPEEITVEFICHQMNFTRKEAMNLRDELERKFKVTVPSLNVRNFPVAR